MSSEQTELGGKAAGLHVLPTAWTPEFFVVSAVACGAWLDSSTRSTISDQSALDAEFASLHLASGILSLTARGQSTQLIVRSNAPNETIEHRGLLLSLKCDATVEAVLSAARRIVLDARSKNMTTGLIIQVYIRAELEGHLSNERRISKDPRRWLIEANIPGDLGATPPIMQPVRVERLAAETSGPILCSTIRSVRYHLRRIGRFFAHDQQRRHMEWVWDGQRLWIVQNDVCAQEVGYSPETAVGFARPPVRGGQLNVFRPFSPRDAKRWQKLECVASFQTLGFSLPDLFVLQGSKAIRAVANDSWPAKLVDDLSLLTTAPLVIRSDIARQTKYFAPRTDTLQDVESAKRFLLQACRQFLDKGASPDQVCFIAHRFIPAEAAAFSLATPGSSRVRVDALWGLPDGLTFSPHDSFEVDGIRGVILDQSVRYKPRFLVPLPSNEWKECPLSAPWDWRRTLSRDDLRYIAEGSLRIASQLRTTVQTMWFVRVAATAGLARIIPWRYTTEAGTEPIQSTTTSRFHTPPIVVHNPSDLERLESQGAVASSIVLRPDGPHLREEEFLKDLAQAAQRHHLRIDLEGSALSHAFYVLKRHGATVACVNALAPKSIRRRFDKLVRDKIPLKIKRQGEAVETVSISDSELREVLRAKLVEEALEVLWADSLDTVVEELADVFEVLCAIGRRFRKTPNDIEEAARAKRGKLGGFEKGLILVETQETPLVEVCSEKSLFPAKAVRRTRSVGPAVIATGRRPKTRPDRILIPLVPATRAQAHGPFRVELRQYGVACEVTYQEKVAEVVFSRLEKREQAGQLKLAF